MDGTASVVVGDRGRIVLPADLRSRAGLEAGTPMILVESDDGIVLMTRQQALRRVRSSMAGTSLVDELLRERRAAAATEDAGTS